MWPIVLAIVALAGLPGVSAQLYNDHGIIFPDCISGCYNFSYILATTTTVTMIRRRWRNVARWSDKGAFQVDEYSDYHLAVNPFTDGGVGTETAAAGIASQSIPLAAGPTKHLEATAKSQAHLAAASSSRLSSSGSSEGGRSGRGHVSVAPSSDGYSENLPGGVPYHAEDGGLLPQPEQNLELPPVYNPQWTPAGSVSESGRSRPASKPA